MSIFLFWLIQTGIDHRIFGLGELFTFVSEGVFLPLKLILLFVCVSVCLFLSLTALGCTLRKRLNKACEKDWVLWLISLAIVVVFFLWAFRITIVSFMTNDDTSILRAIAGIPKNGLDHASGAFSNILFCGLLSLFYRIDPEGWWYTGYHLAAILCSCTIIGRCILLKIRRRGWPILIGCFILFFLCTGVILYPLSELSFTVTPAIAGSAAVALVLCRNETKKLSGRVVLDIVSVILMVLCYMQRVGTGKALLCFWALAVAYQAVKTILLRYPQWKKQLLSLGICVLSVLLLVGACRISRTEVSYDAEYSYAEKYRALVMDYLLGDLSTEDLEAAGIPYELGVLLHQWYFMDERISTETFQTLVTRYYTESVSKESASPLSVLLASMAETVEALFYGSVRPWLTALSLLLLTLSLLGFIRHGRKYWLEALCSLCSVGGAFVLCLYLIMRGRFLFRAYLVVFIPAIITLLIMALSQPESTRETPCPLAYKGATVLLVIACCVACLFSAYNTPSAKSDVTREYVFGDQWQIEAYANENSDLLFVTNSTMQNLDPFHGGSYPTNIKLWGGTGVTASSNRLYDGDFFRDDVRLMYESSDYLGYFMLLLQFLTRDNGPVYVIHEAQITDSISVYNFKHIIPVEDYTGWYEWNGMTYYFENGQALTGTHVIDGVEYEFAPIGYLSPMISLNTNEGSIYTTKAYSLVSTDS